MECSHFTAAVQLTRKQVKEIQPQRWNCAVCKTQKSPWICLSCGTVLCGRYVNGHAREHAVIHPGHCVCMDLGLSIYCYKDDEFIVNENQMIQELRMEIERKMEMQKSPQSSPGDLDHRDEALPPTKMAKTEMCPDRTCGLQNLGNTCFMNAIMQPLNNLEPFCDYFNHLPSSVELKSSDETKKHVHCYNTRRNGDKMSLVEEMGKVSWGLWQNENAFFSPHSLFSVVWKLVPRFRGYQQQDAHEFMRYLLDNLHSELCKASQVATPSTTLTSSTQDTPLTTHTHGCNTIVSDTFGGVLQSDVTCLTCNTESRKLDPILDISLDIPVNKVNKERNTQCTITDCLSRFTSKETLDETEWYYCAHCKRKQPSTKQLSLHSLPKVLCLHLKRFRFTSFLRTKVNTPVNFPLHSLDLSPFTVGCHGDGSTRTMYDLASVVVHHGSGASCGHYTAYVYAPNAGFWYHFNDSSVSETTLTRVSDSRPYMLFYVQRIYNSKYYNQTTTEHKQTMTKQPDTLATE